MERERANYLEGTVSVIINTLLFLVKYYAGTTLNSLAIKADAWHTISDSLSSIGILIIGYLSSRKPDREHPYGHGRWEPIGTLFLAVFLALMAFDFLKESLFVINRSEKIEYGELGIAVTIISIIVKEALAQFAFYMGRKSGSPTVIADGWHHRSDSLSSIVVLLGIILSNSIPFIDNILGGGIAVLLLLASYRIGKDAVSKLMGENISPDLVIEIQSIAKRLSNDNLEPHGFRIHNYITHIELTFNIYVDEKLSVGEAHDLVTSIENEIRKELSIESTIHIEPFSKSKSP